MTRQPRRALRALLTSILVVTGIGVAAGAPAQAAPPARLDLVLLLDGSGSIDDDDWKLQLDGYAEALRDRTNFPLDGSVAVSLIQWSRGGSSRPSTRVEVPLTVLDSEATVEQVRQAVLDISQMGHDTNPGDAIAAGTDELALHGRAGANRSLCMATDGIINSGRTMVDAVAYAKTGGVDRYSVIAIEDGSFTEARARSSYGPYVFGGGQVTVARTTAEFTTMITGCVAEPLQLVALEVTQGLQDLDNTVSLVETRDTLVRAYLATTDDSLRRATARLHVTRNGTPIPGSPFTPTNAEAPVDGNALGDRGNLGATLNYRIPAAEAHGTWDLRLEYGGGLTCTRQAQNPTCGEQVTFRQGMDMDLEMVGVTWGPPINREVAEGVAWAAGVVRGAPELMEQAERIRSQLPVSSLDVRWRVLAVSIPPVGGATFLGLLARMDILRAFENRPVWGPGDTVSVTHAVVPGKNPRGKGHIAGLSRGLVSAAYDADASGPFDISTYRNFAPHEVGHSVGLAHSVNAAQNGYETDGAGERTAKNGWCNEVGPLDAPEWEFTRLNAAGDTVAAFGPHEPGRRSQVWGTEVRFTDPYLDRRSVSPWSDLALTDPETKTSLMSYCKPDVETGNTRWIGVPDWERLVEQASTRPQPHIQMPPHSATPHALLQAVMADGETSVLPVLPINLEVTADDPTGTHAVAMLDADGAVVHQVRLTPTAVDGDTAQWAAGTVGSTVSVVLPEVEGIVSIELREGADVLATVPVSENAPQASVGAPTTGDQENVTFTWNATDADGDDLAYALRYSADDGATWTTMGIDLEGDSVSLPRWALAGSDAARVQVIASDGVNTAVATSDAFSMPNLAPEVALTTPVEGTAVCGAQTIVFTGTGFDAEDGDLSDQLVWSSDLDGRLGTGAELMRRADELSEGTHRITVTARDSAGVTSSATVELVVHRIAPVVDEPADPADPQQPAEPAATPSAQPGEPTAPAAAVPAPGNGGGGLARTGLTVLPWCLAALTAIGVGTLLVRNRSRSRGQHVRA